MKKIIISLSVLLLLFAVALPVAQARTFYTWHPPVYSPVYFYHPEPTATCNTANDCRPGSFCMVTGPVFFGRPAHKVCVFPGQIIPY